MKKKINIPDIFTNELVLSLLKTGDVSFIDKLMDKINYFKLDNDDKTLVHTIFFKELFSCYFSDKKNEEIASYYLQNYAEKESLFNILKNIVSFSHNDFLPSFYNITQSSPINIFPDQNDDYIIRLNHSIELSLLIESIIEKNNPIDFIEKFPIMSYMNTSLFKNLVNNIEQHHNKEVLLFFRDKYPEDFIHQFMVFIDSNFLYSDATACNQSINQFLPFYTNFNSDEKNMTYEKINFFIDTYKNHKSINFKNLKNTLEKIDYYYIINAEIQNKNQILKKPIKI